jgi:hypothetical protein
VLKKSLYFFFFQICNFFQGFKTSEVSRLGIKLAAGNLIPFKFKLFSLSVIFHFQGNKKGAKNPLSDFFFQAKALSKLNWILELLQFLLL